MPAATILCNSSAIGLKPRQRQEKKAAAVTSCGIDADTRYQAPIPQQSRTETLYCFQSRKKRPPSPPTCEHGGQALQQCGRRRRDDRRQKGSGSNRRSVYGQTMRVVKAHFTPAHN